MAIGTAIPIGIWIDQHWMQQIFISFNILGNFFIAYRLRDLQNIGTSWRFFCIYMGAVFVCTCFDFAASLQADCGGQILHAIGFTGLALC